MVIICTILPPSPPHNFFVCVINQFWFAIKPWKILFKKEQALSTPYFTYVCQLFRFPGGLFWALSLKMQAFGKVTVCVLMCISFEMPSWSFTEEKGTETALVRLQIRGWRAVADGRSSTGHGVWSLKSNSAPPPLSSPGLYISVHGVTTLSLWRPWSYLWLSSLLLCAACCQSYGLYTVYL